MTIERKTDLTIAKTIMAQIKTIDRMALMAWGAKNFIGSEDGIAFDVNGPKHRGRITIKLNDMDLYDIQAGHMNRRTFDWIVDAEESDVYVEDLVRFLDGIIG